MHLLKCPACDASTPVSPAQAGDSIRCPNCQSPIEVPKLGDLRKLPRADSASRIDENPAAAESSAGSRIAFVALSLLGLVCLLIAGFCGIRYLSTDASMTTAAHVAEQRAAYQELTPAELIRVWEGIEEYGIETTAPTEFRLTELEKESLGTKTAVSGGLGLASVIAAIGVAIAGRRRRGG